MTKLIVGLGCSWTQGEGAYPEEFWRKWNGRVRESGMICDEDRRHYEIENNWVNVLTKDYFQDYQAINLGIKGIGNRAAVKQLYFADLDWKNSEGYAILLLSGFERFSFINTKPFDKLGNYQHYKWKTIWPIPGHGDDYEPLYRFYAEKLCTEESVAAETMLALLEFQEFFQGKNFKLVVANAYGQYSENPNYSVEDFLQDYANPLYKKFDWSIYLHRYTEYRAMVERLVKLDGLDGLVDWTHFYRHYEALNYPAKYITNDSHPTINGYKEIANEFAKFINNRHLR